MKKCYFLTTLMLILTLTLSINTQAQTDPKPVYITVTTMHRNLTSDGKDWRKTEQEYFDKVTSKNDLIIGSEILTHYYTANSTEILHISVYKTWEDIEKSGDVSDELINLTGAQPIELQDALCCDCVVLMTDHDLYREILPEMVKSPIFICTRPILNFEEFKNNGIIFKTIGRGT